MGETIPPGGKNSPSHGIVVIEITGGAVFVDRGVNAPMFDFSNYRVVPNTQHFDGDTTDMLVIRDFDFAPTTIKRIQNFFEHYLDLVACKWVRVERWGDAAEARKMIADAVERAKA